MFQAAFSAMTTFNFPTCSNGTMSRWGVYVRDHRGLGSESATQQAIGTAYQINGINQIPILIAKTYSLFIAD